MRRQKNTQQVKEQGQNTPDLTNEEEIGSLSEKEFRIMIVKMIQNLGNRIDRMQETFKKDVDRKSTRLNSSHITISYAVFCLKKKEWTQINEIRNEKTEKHTADEGAR